MKKLLVVILVILLPVFASAQKKGWTRVEASGLGILGKAFDTPNPYHRIDTCVYKGFTPSENAQCRVPAGLAVMFKTDAERIGVSVEYGSVVRKDAFRSYRGFDLYIRKDGKWRWAGNCTFDRDFNQWNKVQDVVKNLAPGEKECLLYLPLYTELNSCKICVPRGSKVEKVESDFRHKIVFHGSSLTHGIGLTRAGMSYPMQFMRRTGLQVIPLGFSANCKMQPYFADVLVDIDADAYVFDAFSNSTMPIMRERLFPFIERLMAAHPGKPLIFQSSIYQERENFDTRCQAEYSGRRAVADSLMRIACKKWKDVYYLVTDTSLHTDESSTADGIHPNDNGYTIWVDSIEKPLLKILKKYGIKRVY